MAGEDVNGDDEALGDGAGSHVEPEVPPGRGATSGRSRRWAVATAESAWEVHTDLADALAALEEDHRLTLLVKDRDHE